jgi:hypothetical protein
MVGSLPGCARATSGQAAAEHTMLMKSRRRIAFPQGPKLRDLVLQLQQDFASGGMGFRRQIAQQQS